MNAAPPPAFARLCLEPIGHARTSLGTKVEAARQPRAAQGTPGRIELLPGRHFEHALEDLDGWEVIWVVFWFHLNPSWRPKVLPPRSTSGRKGVFSTRSPHRPNPIGLSAVRLDRIEGLTLHLLDVDFVDGTPVLDIKPYVPYTDAHPRARSGWLEDGVPAAGLGAADAARGVLDSPADPVAAYDIAFGALAAEQVAWIEARSELKLGERIRSTLQLGPEPHPYRRIRPDGAGLRLAIKEWRIRFTVAGRAVQVLAITSGYRPAQLALDDAALPADDPRPLHRDFLSRWQEEGTLPFGRGDATL
jgi:tRNA-Thr(GGU) m(6)t(6)A37 methyltransferase TsaA